MYRECLFSPHHTQQQILSNVNIFTNLMMNSINPVWFEFTLFKHESPWALNISLDHHGSCICVCFLHYTVSLAAFVFSAPSHTQPISQNLKEEWFSMWHLQSTQVLLEVASLCPCHFSSLPPLLLQGLRLPREAGWRVKEGEQVTGLSLPSSLTTML